MKASSQKTDALADVKKLAEILEKEYRCEECKGEGATTECRRMDCADNQGWHESDVCERREHQEFRACGHCLGEIYLCSDKVLKILAKYVKLKPKRKLTEAQKFKAMWPNL